MSTSALTLNPSQIRPYLPVLQLCPWVWIWESTDSSLWRSWVWVHCRGGQKPSFAHSFSVRGWGSWIHGHFMVECCLAWICPGFMQARAATVSSLVKQSLSPSEDTVCCGPPRPLDLKSFCPLFWDGPCILGRGCDTDAPFVAEFHSHWFSALWPAEFLH